MDGVFDIIVIGGGHAGCEAALSSARLGMNTLLLTLSPDSIAFMPCNPHIGGTGKGHLVREIDALGGEMGLAADSALLQLKMLNEGKGPAVHSLRGQIDKALYHRVMKSRLEKQSLLSVKQDEAVRIITEGGRAAGVVTAMGRRYEAKAVIISTGVYLKARIITGEYIKDCGPAGFLRSEGLTDGLLELGLPLRRFKTGTPPRVAGSSIDYSKTELQPGDDIADRFSFMTEASTFEQIPCYLTYTNERTHDIIRANLKRAPLFNGEIQSVGPRYCPSIEGKVMTFKDKERHQLFIEPEGADTDEKYIQGLSSSLPYDVQLEMLHTIPGLEKAEIVRPGYAIEYDCIDPTALSPSLMVKDIPGLFSAGQMNGSSGYEEAAAQGLMAGINAALMIKGEPCFILKRSEAYIGVLIDDLVTKGTNEPYRMMTARAEYRLTLRQDNADLRLTEYGNKLGLVSKARYDKYLIKREETGRINSALSAYVSPKIVNPLLESKNESPAASGIALKDLLKRQNITMRDIIPLCPDLDGCTAAALATAETDAKYEGYIVKQDALTAEMRKLEECSLPSDLDYKNLDNLRLEARAKLNAVRPVNLGQASRISGVSPADINVLMIYLAKRKKQGGVS